MRIAAAPASHATDARSDSPACGTQPWRRPPPSPEDIDDYDEFVPPLRPRPVQGAWARGKPPAPPRVRARPQLEEKEERLPQRWVHKGQARGPIVGLGGAACHRFVRLYASVVDVPSRVNVTRNGARIPTKNVRWLSSAL